MARSDCGPLFSVGGFRQVKDLARIDLVGIADLPGIGLVDRGVFDAPTIDAASNGPEIVAAADDGLAGGETGRLGIADRSGDHGRNGISGNGVHGSGRVDRRRCGCRGWGRRGRIRGGSDRRRGCGRLVGFGSGNGRSRRRQVDLDIDLGAGCDRGAGALEQIGADALDGLGQHIARFDQPAAIGDQCVGNEGIVDIEADGATLGTGAGKEGFGTLDLDGVDGGRGEVERRRGWRRGSTGLPSSPRPARPII